MKTKQTLLTVAGTLLLLLNASMLNAQWSAVRYDQHNTFNKVCAPNANTVFVTGVDPWTSLHFILRTNDGGVNWDSISFNTATDIYEFSELYFVDVNTGFAGGLKNSNQVLLKTIDNGNSWTEITPNPSSPASIGSIHFIDAQNGYATDGAALYKTFNGGTSWTLVPAPFTMRDLFFTDMNHGFACGEDGAAVLMYTPDGGVYWTPKLSVSDPNLPVSSFARLNFISPNIIFTALENSNKLYRTLDNAYTWDTIFVDSINAIRDFDFMNANDGHVLGEIWFSGEIRILLTADGGENSITEYTTGWNFYGGGVVLNAFDFVEGTGYTTGSHGLVKKYTPSTAGISEEVFSTTASVYPNPFSVSATFSITNWNKLKVKHAGLKIYDAFGREVFQSEISDAEFELQRGDLPRGIYMYRINNGSEIIANGKLVVAG